MYFTIFFRLMKNIRNRWIFRQLVTKQILSPYFFNQFKLQKKLNQISYSNKILLKFFIPLFHVGLPTSNSSNTFHSPKIVQKNAIPNFLCHYWKLHLTFWYYEALFYRCPYQTGLHLLIMSKKKRCSFVYLKKS